MGSASFKPGSLQSNEPDTAIRRTIDQPPSDGYPGESSIPAIQALTPGIPLYHQPTINGSPFPVYPLADFEQTFEWWLALEQPSEQPSAVPASDRVDGDHQTPQILMPNHEELLGTIPTIDFERALVEWLFLASTATTESTQRQQRRVRRACENCRSSKRRCSHGRPCERCVRNGIVCNY